MYNIIKRREEIKNIIKLINQIEINGWYIKEK